jgi:hypothetical protein
MTRIYDMLSLDVFDKKSLIGRSERDVKAFAEQALIPTGQVRDPVSVVMIRNKAEVIDGTKRVLACQWIQENIENEEIKAKFTEVPVQIFESISVAERAIYSIVSNEHRSDNPLSAYFRMKDLIKKGKWKEYAKIYKLNPSTFKKLATLDNLKKFQQKFFDAFNEGQVVMSTLFAVAKLDEIRQKMCLNILKENEKLTAGDVREVKSTEADKVLSTMDFDTAGIASAAQTEGYIVLGTDDRIMTFKEAMESKGKGRVFKLQLVGGKQ